MSWSWVWYKAIEQSKLTISQKSVLLIYEARNRTRREWNGFILIYFPNEKKRNLMAMSTESKLDGNHWFSKFTNFSRRPATSPSLVPLHIVFSSVPVAAVRARKGFLASVNRQVIHNPVTSQSCVITKSAEVNPSLAATRRWETSPDLTSSVSPQIDSLVKIKTWPWSIESE